MKKQCVHITQNYVQQGFSIVSGMAKGIDACAATVCINEGGYTIAVLGNGVDICYPSEHQLLMEKIREKDYLSRNIHQEQSQHVTIFQRETA